MDSPTDWILAIVKDDIQIRPYVIEASSESVVRFVKYLGEQILSKWGCKLTTVHFYAAISVEIEMMDFVDLEEITNVTISQEGPHELAKNLAVTIGTHENPMVYILELEDFIGIMNIKQIRIEKALTAKYKGIAAAQTASVTPKPTLEMPTRNTSIKSATPVLCWDF